MFYIRTLSPFHRAVCNICLDIKLLYFIKKYFNPASINILCQLRTRHFLVGVFQSKYCFIFTNWSVCLFRLWFCDLLKVYVIFAYNNNYYAQIQQQKPLIYVNYGDTYSCNNSIMQLTRFFVKIWVIEFTSVQCRQSLIMVSVYIQVCSYNVLCCAG